MIDPNLSGVVVHYGELSNTVAFVEETIASSPGVALTVVNNGPDDDATLRARLPVEVDVVGGGTNRGFAAAANLGIECSLERGIDDVVVLSNDGVIPPGALRDLQLAASAAEATVAGPLVLYKGSDLIWADGLDIDHTWGIARNSGKGQPRDRARGSRSVRHVPGHCILLRKCGARPWLRFDEDFFMYYEDVALCDEVAAHHEKVLLTDRVVVYHDKPERAGYRFGKAQQRHMARSGLIYWAKHVAGVRRVSHLIGFLALTVFRLARSDGVASVWAGFRGVGSGCAAAIGILRGRGVGPPGGPP